jgi:hypothetical protein
MAASTARYQYHELDANRDEIRLIAVQPGTPKDPIVVALRTESLLDNPSYEAISYAWGDESVKRPIRIERC